jgi:hypothetical protein
MLFFWSNLLQLLKLWCLLWTQHRRLRLWSFWRSEIRLL